MLTQTWIEILRLDLKGHFKTFKKLYLITVISNDDNRLFCVANSASDDIQLFQRLPFNLQFNPTAELSNGCPIQLGHAQCPQNLAFPTFATDTNSLFTRVTPWSLILS